MKKIFWLSLCLFALLQKGLAQEQPLDLSANYVTPEVFKTRVDNFKVCFSMKDQEEFDYGPDTVNYSFLQTLKNRIDTSGLEPGSYFKVLRIFYGLDATGKRIRLFYFPDIARFNSANNSYLYMHRNPDSNDRFYYFEHNTYDLKDVPFRAAARYLVDYRNMMQVKPHAHVNDVARELSIGEDSTYDATGVVYSFQAILKRFSGHEKLYVHNVAELDEAHHVNIFKHSVAFASDAPSIVTVCANLGALCPPRCAELRVRIEPASGLPTIIAIPAFSFDTNQYPQSVTSYESALRENANNASPELGQQDPVEKKNKTWFLCMLVLTGAVAGAVLTWLTMKARK